MHAEEKGANLVNFVNMKHDNRYHMCCSFEPWLRCLSSDEQRFLQNEFAKLHRRYG